MRQLTLSRWIAVWMLAIGLAASTASAQEADTLSISGTFHMHELQGTVGADLASVFARGNDCGWTLTLHGVTYSHEYYYYDWNDERSFGHNEQYITRVLATSFDFEFFGPDADVLNTVVSQQLMTGSLFDNYMYAFLELQNGDYYDSADWESSGLLYSHWNIGLMPADTTAGVLFFASDWPYARFSVDENGYPLVKPQRLTPDQTAIADYRPGNSGFLLSFGDVVEIGSSGPPLPPPPPPTLTIVDGSVREGNKGTTRLELTVTLSRSIKDVVTVNYATVNGTALAKSDFTATSGKLTFQPGQTSRTIAISITTDRKREPNETFSVKLSNAVGATINDAVATATILNDD